MDVIFYIHPANVALRERVVMKRVAASELRVTPYGHKQFQLKDPYGYTLCFSQETDELPTDE